MARGLTPRGWAGRGGGANTVLPVMREYAGSSAMVAGLWPFIVGTGTPLCGVPLGPHLLRNTMVTADHISFFTELKLLRAPSAAVIALNGTGKSSLIRRLITGQSAFGYIPLILGDIKPDYSKLVKRLGGQVIRIGRGVGGLNPLDPGQAIEAVQLLRAAGRQDLATRLLEQSHGRRLHALCGLITIQRGSGMSDREEAVLDAAITVVEERFAGSETAPIIADLLGVVRTPPPHVREMAIDRGIFERYQEVTEALEASLIALMQGGAFGGVFSGHTTVPMRRDQPCSFDLSAIPENESKFRAAAQMQCWSEGFSSVEINHFLSDAGIEPNRNYSVVQDEFGLALQSGPGLVDRANNLSRMERNDGLGNIWATHSVRDLDTLQLESDRTKAKGLIERAGMLFLGALPPNEMQALAPIVTLSKKEQRMLTTWSSPESWTPDPGNANPLPPGMGKFLIKIGAGQRAGIPFRLQLTERERDPGDTNIRWKERSRFSGSGQRAGTIIDREETHVSE